MSHEARGKHQDWITPLYIFEALGVTFDLDVAAPKLGPKYVPCKKWLWNDGLKQQWYGFIWMNPPFGKQEYKRAWLRRFIEHDNGIALMPDRTSAPWFQESAPLMDMLLFIGPKVQFELEDGSRGKAPSNGTVLFALGYPAIDALKNAQDKGLGFITVSRQNQT